MVVIAARHRKFLPWAYRGSFSSLLSPASRAQHAPRAGIARDEKSVPGKRAEKRLERAATAADNESYGAGVVKLASFEAIVRALEHAGVRYLVARGLAVNAHGYLRFTHDVDLVI